MNELFADSVFFGSVLTLLTYVAGCSLKAKFKKDWMNPILISVILCIAALLVLRVDYSTYEQGAKYVSYLLTPSTIALAVPLYEQYQLLRKNWLAALGGIVTGVIVSLVSIFLMSLLFRLDHAQYVTFLPKSITTAIGMELSREMGGYVALTVAVIIITGILGNIIAIPVCRFFRITDPLAVGIAIGTSSHALGTTKALEIGKIEGAMSSLSIVTAGIVTSFAAMLFEHLL